MWLDLRDIIEMPGKSKGFETVLDPAEMLTPSIVCFLSPLRAAGRVDNTAGLLRLRAEMPLSMRCACDRCGTEFDVERTERIEVPLAADPEDGDDGELYPLDGDGVDVDAVVAATFLLNADTKCLCRPDCLGLCPRCGKNLNDGPCGCRNETDPRFAVLEQLLDDKKEESPEQR